MSNSGIEGYRDFLVRRDGDADLLHRRLGSREKFFSTLETDPNPLELSDRPGYVPAQPSTPPSRTGRRSEDAVLVRHPPS